MRRHNRKNNRLPAYNYSQAGYYYVTICTYNRREWFGQIDNGKMVLNEYGQIAIEIWQKIPTHFKNVTLDEFIVMPNHLHGIVIVNDGIDYGIVGNRHACSLHNRKPQYQMVPVIIGSYKSAVSRIVRQMNNAYHFRWQKSFYDHIIRNEQSLQNIRQYISNNPLTWEDDIENVNKTGVIVKTGR